MQGIIYQGTVRNPGFDIEVNDARESLGPRFWWDARNDPRNCRPRTEPIEGAVIHHQGGEGDADNVFNVLNARPRRKRKGFIYLSVHFQIDQKGLITQYADLDTVCKHAGNANGWSWGVEISNRGRGRPSQRWPRDQYRDIVHGQNIDFLAFYPEQHEACLKLVRAVHAILELKTRVPGYHDFDNCAVRDELPDEKMDDYDVFAHHMLTDKKIDPAPDMMDYLLEHLSND